MSDDLGEDIIAGERNEALGRLDRMLGAATVAAGSAGAAEAAAPPADAAPDDGGTTGQSFMGDKGRRAARGATRTVSDVPKAAAIAGRAFETGRAERIGRNAAAYQEQLDRVNSVLTAGATAKGPLTDEQRAIFEAEAARLQLLIEGTAADAAGAADELATPLKESMLYSAGEAIDKAVEGVVGAPDPAREGDFTSLLAEGAGNMGGMMASGMATGSAGPLMQGMSMGAVNQYEAAIRKGADEATALQAAGLGALVGSTDAVPLMYALNRFGPVVKGRIVGALAQHMLKSGVAEAAQEGLQGFLDNLIAQQLYDPEQGLLKDVGVQMLVGFLLGGGAGAGGATRSMIRGDYATTAGDGAAPLDGPDASADPDAAARADALLRDLRADPQVFDNQDVVPVVDLGLGDPNGPLVERAESPEALEAARRERAETGTAFEEARAAIDRELARIDAEIRELGPTVLAVGGSGTFVDRLIGVESGGRVDAKNPNSSATGLGQFLKSTWLRVVRKYEPALAAGRSEADVLALRTDPAISRRMIEHLAKENAGHLRRNGFEATDGNLYLAHFAGPDGAVKLLKAGENATAESVLGKAVIDANPFLRGKTAAWVVSWAAGKIGDPRAARARIGRLRARATRLGEALATAVENTTAEGAEMVRRATATLNAAADRVKLSDLEGIVRRITAVPAPTNDMLTGMIDKLQRGERVGPARPLARMVQRMGGVDPTSSAGVALKDAGITPRTHPGLFKSGGPIRDLGGDIDVEGREVFIAHPELLDAAGMVDPNAFVDALNAEARGEARYLDPIQMEEQAALDDLSNALRDLGVDVDTASPAVVRQMLDEAQARAADSADRLAALDEAPSPEVDPRDVSPDMQEDVTGHLLGGEASPGMAFAYHGTGAEFDTFSMDYIGTGEGDIAFGYGLYFGERPETAKSYADKIGTGRGGNAIVMRVEIPRADRLLDWGATYSEQPASVRAILDGVLADLDADPGTVFRDTYEGPTSDALSRGVASELAGDPTGMDVYDWIATRLGGGKDGVRAASEMLRDAGIPGHRYLDRGSRRAGSGTYNYVIWDESAVRVAPESAPAAPDPRISADPNSPAGRIYINHARIDTEESVHELIQEFADNDAEAIDRRRRGVVTHEETKAAAEKEFRTIEELIGFPPGIPMNAAQAHAAAQVLVSSGEQLRHLAMKAASATATELDIAAAERAAWAHAAIQEVVLGARAEMGRALNALAITARSGRYRMGDLREFMDRNGGRETIRERMAGIVALADSPAAMNHFLRKSLAARTKDAIMELFYGSILSNPQTHIVNIAGNASVALWAPVEQLAASAISRVLPGERVYAGEAAAMAYSMAEGARAGFRLAFGLSSADAKLREALGFNVKGEVAPQRTASWTAEAFGMDPRAPWGMGFNLMGKAIRASGSALARADMFFKAIAYHQAVAKYAYRIATNEGHKGEVWAERVGDLTLDPPAYAADQSADFADYQTFTRPLGERGKKIVAALNAVPGGRLIAPFIGTPTNILKYTLTRTPFAPLSAAVRADIMAGGERGSLALARIALGSMAMTATASLVAEGLITGGGPDDPEKARLWRAMGFQPYSVKVGGHWISYNRMDPIGMLMGITADTTEVAMEGNTDDAAELAIAGALSIKDNILSKTYMRGLVEFMGVIDPRNPVAKGEDWVANTAGSFMPYSAFLGWLARNEDPIIRDRRPPKYEGDQRVGGFLDTMVRSAKARIPGLSSELPPKRDLWGKELSRESGIGWAYDMFAPWAARKITDDPVEKEMIANQVTVNYPPRAVSVKLGSDTSVSVPLTPEEYSEFARIAGELTKERLDRLVASPGFKRLGSGEGSMRGELMRKVFTDSRSDAARMMNARFPDLRARALVIAEETRKRLKGTPVEGQ